MTTIVNSGSTLTIAPATGLTLSADSTIAALGVLNGSGTISGPFQLLNLGEIASSSGVIDINTGTFDNVGTVIAFVGGTVTIENGVTNQNLLGGTLTGGQWVVNSGDLRRILTGPITTLDAALTVSGGSIEDLVGGTVEPIQNTLSVVGTTGLLNEIGTVFSVPGSFEIDGKVFLNSASLAAPGGVTITPTGQMTILTAGTLAGPIVNNGTIENGPSSGPLTLRGSLSGSGIFRIDNGASLDLSTSGTYAQTFIDSSGTAVIDAFSPTGGGTAAIGGQLLSGFKSFRITGGTAAPTALELGSSISRDVFFDSSQDELILDSPANFTGTLYAMVNSSTVVLNGVIANGASLNLNSGIGPNNVSGGILSITENGSLVGTLDIFGQNVPPLLMYRGPYYGNTTFTATPNAAANNTTITLSGEFTICFRAGTRIATPDGDVTVEQLAAGDRVLTHFAGERRVVWIGHRTIDCRRHPDPPAILPVRVAADAFGPGLPRRDLFLSPGHALFVDGALIPVKYLIDGELIRLVEADTVTYYHVELDEHDVLFAEGLPAESYLDTGNRSAFANGGPSVALFPDFRDLAWEALGCAPLVMTGAPVANLRAMLAQRTASATNPPKLALTPAA